MIAYIIAEGASDVELLRRLLPAKFSGDVELLDGQGFDGVKSLARSIAAARRKPVAVVVDAATTDPELIKARRQSLQEVVGSAASTVPVGVIMAVPGLESIFFENPSVLSRLYPNAAGDARLLEMARLNTRQALQSLDTGMSFEDIRRQLIAEIKDEDLPAFRGTKVIQELIDFLEGCQPRPVKIRVEVGPGMPRDLQALKEDNGLKALLLAFVKALTARSWSPDQVATGSSGDMEVHLRPKGFDIHMEPPSGALPTTFVMEVEADALTHHTESS